jgi:hypothetical protein
VSNASDGSWSTFFSNPSRIRCCANGTDDGPGLAALGYWAPVGSGASLAGAQGHGAYTIGAYAVGGLESTIITNFTVTWVIGKPFVDEWEAITGQNDSEAFNGHYLWSEIPDVVSLNCAPIIESSNATVTVASSDEQVADYSLSGSPSVHKPAWSDYYLLHNNTGENGDDVQYNLKYNMTVR